MQPVKRYNSILVKFLVLASVNVVHTPVTIIIFFWKTLLKYGYCLLKI